MPHQWTDRDREVLLVLKRWFAFEHNVEGWRHLADIFHAFIGHQKKLAWGPLRAQWAQIGKEGLYPSKDLHRTSFYCDDLSDRYVRMRRDIQECMEVKKATNASLWVPLREKEDQESMRAIQRSRETKSAKQLRTNRREKKFKERIQVAAACKLASPIDLTTDEEAQVSVDTTVWRRAKVTITVRVEGESRRVAEETEDKPLSSPNVSTVSGQARVDPISQLNVPIVAAAIANNGPQSVVHTIQEMRAPAPMLEILCPPAKKNPRLLFRFSDEHSQGYNEYGFVSGAYKNTPIPSIPRRESVFTDPSIQKRSLKEHLDKEKTSTGYISLTSSLLWAIQKALRSKSRHTAKLSVVDADKLHDKWHVKEQLSSKEVELSPKHRSYTGTLEWVTWGYISEDAVISSFSLEALIELVRSDNVLSEILQIHEDSFRTSGMGRCVGKLRGMPLHLTSTQLGKALISITACILGEQFSLARHSTSLSPQLTLFQELAYIVAENWQLRTRTSHVKLVNHLSRAKVTPGA